MNSLVSEARARLAHRDGFVIPMIIFALVVMGTVAVAAMLTAGDEQRASRAVHESGAAFYAAEAGLNQEWATWDDTLVAGLDPGDTLDLGWQTLDNGASYQAMIQRYDNDWSGMQTLFALTVEGRGAGPAGGQRVLSMALAATPAAVAAWGVVSGSDIKIGGHPEILGPNGALLVNGDIVVTGGASPIFDQCVGATGMIINEANITCGSGSPTEGADPVVIPTVDIPSYEAQADFVMRADGQILNVATTTLYPGCAPWPACTANGYPGGTPVWGGWVFSCKAGECTFTQKDLASDFPSGLYYFETNVFYGASGDAAISIVSEMSVKMNQDGNLTAAVPGALLIGGGDVVLNGKAGLTLDDGCIYAGRYFRINGQADINGCVVGADLPLPPGADGLTTESRISGNGRITVGGETPWDDTVQMVIRPLSSRAWGQLLY